MMKRHFLSLLLLCNALAIAAENYPYRDDFLWVAVPDHADWLYQCGEKASVEVQLLRYGMPVEAVVEWEIGSDLLEADQRGTTTLKSGRARIAMGTARKPGFRDLRLRATIDGQTTRHHVKVGFSVDQIKPFTQEPKDFRTFWQQQLDEAGKFPLKYSREPAPEFSTDQIDAWKIKLTLDRQRHSFYAYLLMPKGATKGSCPVMLTPPGAGVKTIKDAGTRRFWTEGGFIRLCIDIHGLDPAMSDRQWNEVNAAFNSRWNTYFLQTLDNREQYYMKHVYLGLVRCIDLLTSLPEWDGRNVVVQGGSQGGALSLIAAALDKRITLCVANHPALADMAAGSAGLTSGYPHFTRESGAYDGRCLENLPYFDVVNFARYVECPVFLTWGYNDNTCPPTTSYAVWNTLKSEKECLLTPINEHWTSDATDRRQMEWVKKRLK
jgi:cephalosporin-C deacetylase-like acetyl esterase